MKAKSPILLSAIALLCITCCRTAMAEPQDSGTHYAAEAVNPYIKSGECPGAISILYQNGKQAPVTVGNDPAQDAAALTTEYESCTWNKVIE